MLDTTLNAMHTNKLAKVVALEGVGHVANLDNPEVFDNCLNYILSHINS